MMTTVYVVFFRKREGNYRRKERGRGQDYWEGNRKWKLLSLVFLLREEKDMMMANDLSSVARVCQRTLNKHRETEKEGQQRRGTQKTNKSKRMIPVMNLCQLCTKFSFTWITVFFKIVKRERKWNKGCSTLSVSAIIPKQATKSRVSASSGTITLNFEQDQTEWVFKSLSWTTLLKSRK